MHPEYRAFSRQNLRDQVAYLRRVGYIRTNLQQVLDQAANRIAPIPSPVRRNRSGRASLLQIADIDLRARDRINIKISVKPPKLVELDGLIDEELPEDADLWQINGAVYSAARRVVPEG